jgi:hypothetical protein
LEVEKRLNKTFERARTKVNLVVQDNTQEGIVDLNLAIVLDEAQFLEFVHEKIDPGPRCANHLRQHLLRYFGKRFVRMARRAIAPEQQQRTCQTREKAVDGSTEQSGCRGCDR